MTQMLEQIFATRRQDTTSRQPAGLPGKVKVSFEFFPPKTEAMARTLWNSIEKLAPLAPEFISVTYGAGGSTRQRTHETVVRVARETSLESAAHLTCVNASRAEIDELLDQYWDAGIRHVVALRGDPPDGSGRFVPHPDGYANAVELVAGIRARRPFDISVAAYPEVHPEALSADADLDFLKRKIDAGASRAMTQFFFEPDRFLRFRDRAAAAGITADILPGILPVTNFAAARRMASACHVHVPDWMEDQFADLDDQPETRMLVAASIASDMVQRLYAEGVRHFHFYTLNRAELTYAICHMLGVRPK